MSKMIPVFNYAELGTGGRQIVEECRDAIHEHGIRTAQTIIGIGQQLSRAKGQLNHGQWSRWLAAEFPSLTDRTAQRWMNAAAIWKNANMSEVDMSQRALLLLAGAASSPEARNIAIEVAKEGEKLTAPVAHEIIQHVNANTTRVSEMNSEPDDSESLSRPSGEFFKAASNARRRVHEPAAVVTDENGNTFYGEEAQEVMARVATPAQESESIGAENAQMPPTQSKADRDDECSTYCEGTVFLDYPRGGLLRLIQAFNDGDQDVIEAECAKVGILQ